MTLRELVVKLGIETDENKIKSFETSLTSVKRVMGNVAKGALAVTGALVSIGAGAFALTSEVAKTGDAIAKMARDLNINGESLQEWTYLSGLAGISSQELNTNLSFFNRQLMEATKGTGKTADWLDKLGISLRDGNGAVKDQNSLLVELATAFEGINDPATKTAIAIDMFGRNGARMAQLLDAGVDNIEALKNEARELGGILSNETLSASETFQDSMLRLQTVFTGIKNQLGGALIPLMNTFVDALTAVGKEMSTVLQPFIQSLSRTLAPIMQILISLIKSAMQLLVPVLDILMKIIGVLVPLFDPIFKLLDVLISLVEKLLPILINPLLELIEMISGLLLPVLNDMIELFDLLFEPLMPVFKMLMNMFMVLIKQHLLPFFVTLKLISMVLRPLIAFLAGLFQVLTPILNVMQWLAEVVNYFSTVLYELLFNLMDKGFARVTGVISSFGRLFTSIFRAIPDTIRQLWEYFDRFITSLGERFPLIGRIFTSLQNIFSDVVFNVKRWFADMINWIVQKINWAIEKMNSVLPANLRMGMIQAVNVENEVIRQADATQTYNTTNFRSQNTFNVNAGTGTTAEVQTAIQESARALFQIELKKLVLNAGY